MKAFEQLKTTAKIAGQVIQGRASVDTLIPSRRNHVVGEIVRCTCTPEEKALPTFHAFAEHELDRVCPKGLASGEFVEGWNSRVNGGASAQANLMGNTTAAAYNYVALAASALTITNTDTYLGSNSVGTNEINANGCGRTAGTYTYGGAPASLGASTYYTITKTFTCTTASQTVAAVGLFNSATAQSAGVFVEANLTTSASLAVGDSLAITYTINI